MVGIKDIAKKAGVSISTVSYALNGSPKVTEKTRKRIMTI
ncbi:LacI family DNA-binding transcriptional regulator, partial [Listeria monocytogenes]